MNGWGQLLSFIYSCHQKLTETKKRKEKQKLTSSPIPLTTSPQGTAPSCTLFTFTTAFLPLVPPTTTGLFGLTLRSSQVTKPERWPANTRSREY